MKTILNILATLVAILALIGALAAALLVLWVLDPAHMPGVDLVAQTAIDAGSDRVNQEASNLKQDALNTLATALPPRPTRPAAVTRHVAAPTSTPQSDFQPVAQANDASSDSDAAQPAPADTPAPPEPTAAPPALVPTRAPANTSGRRTKATQPPVQRLPPIVNTPVPPAADVAVAPQNDQPVQQPAPAIAFATPAAQAQVVLGVGVNAQQAAGAVAAAVAPAPDLRADPLRVDNSNPAAMTLINGSEIFIVPQANWCTAAVRQSAVVSSIDPNPVVEPRALELVGHAYSLKLKGQYGLWQQIVDYSMKCPGVTDRAQMEKDIYALVTGR